jgi:hypothetical protein
MVQPLEVAWLRVRMEVEGGKIVEGLAKESAEIR